MDQKIATRRIRFWIIVAIIELLVIGFLYVYFSQPLGYDATGSNRAECYDEDDTPPKNYLKIDVAVKPQKETRFRLFDLNDLDYTGCIETDDEDNSMSFTTYVDTTGHDLITFDGKMRSVSASKNKVKIQLTLSTQKDSVIDKIEITETIYGTVRSVIVRDSLLFKPIKP